MSEQGQKLTDLKSDGMCISDRRCPTCGSEQPDVRLCLHCKRAHIVISRTESCDLVCGDYWHESELSSLRAEVERLNTQLNIWKELPEAEWRILRALHTLRYADHLPSEVIKNKELQRPDKREMFRVLLDPRMQKVFERFEIKLPCLDELYTSIEESFGGTL